MSLRDSKFTPIAFWLAFLALGFVTSFAGPPHAPVKDRFAAEQEATTVSSAQD